MQRRHYRYGGRMLTACGLSIYGYEPTLLQADTTPSDVWHYIPLRWTNRAEDVTCPACTEARVKANITAMNPRVEL